MWMSLARRLIASCNDQVDQLDDRGVAFLGGRPALGVASVSVKSICVSVNSASIESTDSVSVWP